jgi:hypothetical protein
MHGSLPNARWTRGGHQKARRGRVRGRFVCPRSPISFPYLNREWVDRAAFGCLGRAAGMAFSLIFLSARTCSDCRTVCSSQCDQKTDLMEETRQYIYTSTRTRGGRMGRPAEDALFNLSRRLKEEQMYSEIEESRPAGIILLDIKSLVHKIRQHRDSRFGMLLDARKIWKRICWRKRARARHRQGRSKIDGAIFYRCVETKP